MQFEGKQVKTILVEVLSTNTPGGVSLRNNDSLLQKEILDVTDVTPENQTAQGFNNAGFIAEFRNKQQTLVHNVHSRAIGVNVFNKTVINIKNISLDNSVVRAIVPNNNQRFLLLFTYVDDPTQI